MKGIALIGIGGPTLLQYSDLETPSPDEDAALVRVEYCGLNHLDILIRQGKRPGPTTFPHVLGSEIVGTIEKLPKRYPHLSLGDRVVVYPWTYCSVCPQCQSGRENICDNGGTIGRTVWGGYAEYVAVPVKNLLKIPESLSSDVVCAATLTGTTAVHLIERARIPDHTVVLVTGSTGGVGTLVIQLLKNKSCTVIATTSHTEKEQKLRTLGVDHVVPTDQIRSALTYCPPGFPYVIDIMGGRVWSEAVTLVGKNGTLVYCSTTLEGKGSVDIAPSFFKQITLIGSYGGTREHLHHVLRLITQNTLKPIIDSVFPLSQANDAQNRLEHQDLFGKILLDCQ